MTVGALTEQASRFLDASVAAGLNVLVSGGTQTGKTTLLKAMCATIPARERVVTVEEVFELQVALPDVVWMQTRQANLEGTGEIPLRRLVEEALRVRRSGSTSPMRPDVLDGKRSLTRLASNRQGHAGRRGKLVAWLGRGRALTAGSSLSAARSPITPFGRALADSPLSLCALALGSVSAYPAIAWRALVLWDGRDSRVRPRQA